MKKLVVVDPARTVYENMAINHACLDAVSEGVYDQIIRVYGFSRPGAILSNHQDIWDIREEARVGLDITRRPTGGSVVLVDGNTIGYSVFLKTESKIDVIKVYRKFTERVVSVLERYQIPDLTQGDWYVKINGGVVAGHAQQNRGFVSEFQGLIRLTKWDMPSLAKTLRLRKLAENDGNRYIIIDDEVYNLNGNQVNIVTEHLRIVRDEHAELAAAPALTEYGITKDDLIDRLASSLAELDERHALPQELLDNAALHEKHYRDPDWVHKKDGDITRCLGHCFIDLVEQEPVSSTKPL